VEGAKEEAGDNIILLTKGFYRSTYISGDTIGSRQKKNKGHYCPWLAMWLKSEAYENL
jgi:hypothetical protein